MLKNIFVEYNIQIFKGVITFIIIQILICILFWFVFNNVPKLKYLFLSFLTIAILQVSLSIGYLIYQNRKFQSICVNNEFNTEWRIRERIRIEKLINGYKRTTAIQIAFVLLVSINIVILKNEIHKYIALVLVLQLGLSTAIDSFGKIKSKNYYLKLK